MPTGVTGLDSVSERPFCLLENGEGSKPWKQESCIGDRWGEVLGERAERLWLLLTDIDMLELGELLDVEDEGREE